MMDITERLRELDLAEFPHPADSVVRADVARGRKALTRRRMRRSAGAGITLLAVAGIGSAVSLGRPAGVPAPQALSTHTQAPVVRHPAIKLVDYTGPQKHGFVVSSVPEGWTLQESQPGYLTVAPPGNTSDGSLFIGKIAVMLRSVDDHGPLRGVPVTINGDRGALDTARDGTRTVSWVDGSHTVQVQVWANVTLTDAQVIDFARGVSVTADVQVTHG